jgi:hypothetical protein
VNSLAKEELTVSHIVTVRTEIRDPTVIPIACRRLGLAEPTYGTAQLFSGEATGFLVQLPGWLYPVVIEPENGQIYYDNYQEYWGKQAELDRFLQAYAVEKAKLTARRRGHTVTEQPLADGSIKLTIQLGGGA